jgi:hypothetical protein
MLKSLRKHSFLIEDVEEGFGALIFPKCRATRSANMVDLKDVCADHVRTPE